jgi:hypothetical protein
VDVGALTRYRRIWDKSAFNLYDALIESRRHRSEKMLLKEIRLHCACIPLQDAREYCSLWTVLSLFAGGSQQRTIFGAEMTSPLGDTSVVLLDTGHMNVPKSIASLSDHFGLVVFVAVPAKGSSTGSTLSMPPTSTAQTYHKQQWIAQSRSVRCQNCRIFRCAGPLVVA